MESTMEAKVRELLGRGAHAGSYVYSPPALVVHVSGDSFTVEGGTCDGGVLTWENGAIDIAAIDVVHIDPDWSAGR